MGASKRAGVELYHNLTLLFILLFALFFHTGNGLMILLYSTILNSLSACSDRFENLLEDFLKGWRKSCFSNEHLLASLLHCFVRGSPFLGGGSHSLGNVLAFKRGLKESGLLEM
jgi:hypothetical protein